LWPDTEQEISNFEFVGAVGDPVFRDVVPARWQGRSKLTSARAIENSKLRIENSAQGAGRQVAI